MAEIDHIVLGARTLEEGAAFVEQHLGVKPRPGGRHEGFGTHNMLLGLGRGTYLEIIAPDPSQPDPPHRRLFDLDDPSMRVMLEAEPRLIAWVARTPVLDAVVARLGHRAGGFAPHNMLLGLGGGPYREIIAPAPPHPAPPHRRLFDLDDPSMRVMLEAEPRLIAWVARTPVLDAVVARLGHRAGELREMSR